MSARRRAQHVAARILGQSYRHVRRESQRRHEPGEPILSRRDARQVAGWHLNMLLGRFPPPADNRWWDPGDDAPIPVQEARRPLWWLGTPT